MFTRLRKIRLTWPTRRGCLVSLAAMVVIAGLLAIFHRPVLIALARGWIVSNPVPAHAEAIVIPGGGLDTRPFEAARMYQEGVSSRLIVFDTMESEVEAMGITTPHHELILQVLEKLEIPDEAITLIGDDVSSTFDEAETLRDWATANNITDVIVITEIFPSRRVRWIYDKTFRKSGTTPHIMTCAPHAYSAKNWWEHESGLIQFQNEVIKYFYYLAKY